MFFHVLLLAHTVLQCYLLTLCGGLKTGGTINITVLYLGTTDLQKFVRAPHTITMSSKRLT